MNNNSTIGQSCYQINHHLYIKEYYLLNSFHIPAITINNGASEYFLEQSIYWKQITLDLDRWYNFDFIPPEIKQLYNLPEKQNFLETISKDKSKKQDNQSKLYRKEIFILKIALDNADEFIPLFKRNAIPHEKIGKYCNAYAVLEQLLQFRHLKIHENYSLYNSLVNEDFIFQTLSLNHFYTKLNQIKKIGLEQALIHKGFKNKNASKVTKLHQSLVEHFYREGNKLSQRDIYIKVNTVLKSKNEVEISLSSVKQILSDTYRKNLNNIARNGHAWMANSLLPFLIRTKPEYPGDHYQIDATRLQVFCKDPLKQGSFLWIAAVIDGHSGMIMGFAIADKETPDLYCRALKTAFARTNWLPAEILRDNYKGFTQDENLKDLIRQTESLGVTWRAHKVGNPRDKGIIERFFGVFNTVFCKNIFGYTGEGIKSRSVNARPNPDTMKLYKDCKVLMNKSQVLVRITELIHTYNSTGISKGDTPPIEN